MIYRAKVGLQNTKQLISYSPVHSPSHQKKPSLLKQNKFSPKPSHRENKENLQYKEPKTDRGKQEKYFKISKQQPVSSAKKSLKNQKISISISINDKNKNIQQFEDLGLLNIQTPKFKCSSNKIDDRCKTQHFNENENYFSFGDDFRENIKLNNKFGNQFNFNQDKRPILALKERNKNVQVLNATPQKFSIDSVKKKDKIDKFKHNQEKLETKLLLLQKQMKDSKYKKQRQIFCFKK